MALTPFAPLLVRLRVPDDEEERAERLGRHREPVPRGVIWVHAASAGETEGAEPILREISRRRPGAPLLVTSMTRAGKSRAGAIDGALSRFAPLDIPGAVRRFLGAFRPRALLLVETELWPNLIRESVRAGLAVAVVNGRISSPAFRRMLRFEDLYRSVLGRVSLVGAQRETDRERFARFGVPEDRLFVHGNTKIDTPVPEPRELGLSKGEGERWAVFGSVRPGEEEAVARAARELLRRPDVKVIVAPRHPERAALFEAEGISWRRWSEGPDPEARAVLVDTVGDLLSFYARADIAFVGGSLSEHGGHNPLEPARFGVPVLMGPRLDNCREAADLLREAEALEIVDGAEALADRMAWLLGNDGERKRRGRAGRGAIDSARGAAGRLVDRLVRGGILGTEGS
ncbi:MAG: glycosyltransferase N-terminal domain-containing protein [Candidatus Eisenbacteria bacterium]